MAEFKTKAALKAALKAASKEAPKEKPAKSNLTLAMAEINKKHGDGSISRGRSLIANVEAWPTNVATLDIALGCGGMPKGRIIELFGPESAGKTTLCLTCVAAAQAQGMTAAFVDVEHALDPEWATRLGVNMDALLLSQPDTAESALDIVEMLAKTGEVGIVVLDSVAALTPKAELDGEVGDSHIGLQARLMSQAMRKLKSAASNTGCVVIFINQIREKIGVMFGCLHAETLINFVDGSSVPISEVVEKQLGGDVWSWDAETKNFVPRPITGWHHNGEVDEPSDWVSVAVRGPGTKNGRMHLVVTPSHEVMTDTDWTQAQYLAVGDKLLTKQESLVLRTDGQPNGTLGQFLTGMLSGDSHPAHSFGRLAAALKLRDSVDCDYTRWKVDKLKEYLKFTLRSCAFGEYYESACFSELSQLKHEYPKRDPMLLLERFSWLGFAVWIMDDGHYYKDRYHLSIKRFAGDFDKIDQISRSLDDCGLYHCASGEGRITFDRRVSDHIAEKIVGLVPRCMEHKLPAGLRGRDDIHDFVLRRDVEWRDAYARVVEVRDANVRQMKRRGKYDISIAGTTCYSAGGIENGVIVHNSNETTPGGRALKYYASVRMEVKRNGQVLKKGDVNIGYPTRVKIIKNKVGPPFVFADFNLMFGISGYQPGVDKMESLMSVALATDGVFEVAGSWYTFGDKRLLGKDQWKEYVAEHPEMFHAIREKTYSMALKLGRATPVLLDMTDDEIVAAGQDEEDDPDAVEEAVAAQPTTPPAEALGRDDD